MDADIRLKQQKVSGDFHALKVYVRSGGFIVRRNVLTASEDTAELFGRRRTFSGRHYCQLQTVITFEEIKMILRFLITHPRWVWRRYKAVKQAKRDEVEQ
jgi:hypothetical protein